MRHFLNKFNLQRARHYLYWKHKFEIDRFIKKSNLELTKIWKDVEKIRLYKGILYISEMTYSVFIYCNHNNLLIEPFMIEKICKIIMKKYF